MKRTSKTGTGLGALAALACAACCALPVLLAAGVLSGGTAALLADGMPVVAALLAVAAVTAFALAVRRGSRTDGCRTAPADDGCGCGCTTA